MKRLQKVAIAILALLVLGSCQTTNGSKGEGTISEEKVNLSNTVGTFVRAGSHAPAVLLLHGFASSKDEVGDLYKTLANALAERGISSLRIDFRGWGESTFPMEQSTTANMLEDANEALIYLLHRKDVSKVAVHGFSLGCGTAIELAAARPKDIAVMGLWSCITTYDSEYDELEVISPASVQQALTEGKADFDLGWRTITLGKAFFDSLKGHDLAKSYKQFPGKVLIIDGAEDSLVVSLKFFGDIAPARTTTFAVPDADHIYKVLTDDKVPSTALIDKTLAWYTANLK
ncbi:MAG TPA: alpha/beta fold hydrolase [bacterium]|nr:alpha/beta fold hydrolase [bacterium]